MPRLKKTSLAYFPFDVTFFCADEKISDLRLEHGSIGVLTYIDLQCRMYAGRYYIEYKNLDNLAKKIMADISNDQSKRTKERIIAAIHYLVEQAILEQDLFEQGVITGRSVQEQYIISAARSRWDVIMDVYRRVDVLEILRREKINVAKTKVIVTETRIIDAETAQKEMEKEKEREINNTTTTTDSFSLSACAREDDNGTGPTFIDAYKYFTEEMHLPADADTIAEVRAWRTYNDYLGWKCMPKWREAAELWVMRKYNKKE